MARPRIESKTQGSLDIAVAEKPAEGLSAAVQKIKHPPPVLDSSTQPTSTPPGQSSLWMLSSIERVTPIKTQSTMSLVDDLAIKWNAELLKEEPGIFVATGRGMNGDIQTLAHQVSKNPP